MHRGRSRAFAYYLLAGLMIFQALSGLWGGGALILDPSGGLLHMPLRLLDGAPFSNYLVPGIILFVMLGIVPTVVFYGLIRSLKWSWNGAVIVSLALIIWIGVEIAMVGYHADPPLQLVYGLTGILMLIITQLPAVKQILKP